MFFQRKAGGCVWALWFGRLSKYVKQHGGDEGSMDDGQKKIKRILITQIEVTRSIV